MTIRRLRELVLGYARKEGRTRLPWRVRPTPYRVLVSEVMLQQTQVDRVVPYFTDFVARFPSPERLAQAPLRSVLRAWQGLGYNRRGKLLHDAARQIVREHNGRVPRTLRELEQLPGVGPYTARAVRAFAYNEDEIFIETNLRTVVMHHFFPGQASVRDGELLAVLTKALPKGRAREWYAALMDYGSHLKRSGVRINSRSATYVKQRPFKGSTREVRGLVLKNALKGAVSERELLTLLGKDRKAQLHTALATLVRDGILRKAGTRYSLARAGR